MPREWAAPLVARGQLRIIGEDQLTLDFDEFAERLERLCGENFPLPVLRHIFSITGGWSVAIEHAAAYILASSNWRDASENFPDIDRKSVVWGKSVAVLVVLGGRRVMKKKKE